MQEQLFFVSKNRALLRVFTTFLTSNGSKNVSVSHIHVMWVLERSALMSSEVQLFERGSELWWTSKFGHRRSELWRTSTIDHLMFYELLRASTIEHRNFCMHRPSSIGTFVSIDHRQSDSPSLKVVVNEVSRHFKVHKQKQLLVEKHFFKMLVFQCFVLSSYKSKKRFESNRELIQHF